MRHLRNIVILAVVMLGITSCNMQRWCAKRFPPSVGVDTMIIYKDSIHIEYRDTVVPVEIPGETVHDTIPIPCPEPDSEIDLGKYVITQETELCKAFAQLKRDPMRIAMELIQKDTTLLIRLENAQKRIYHLNREITRLKETQIHRERYIPGFYKFTFWWFWGTVGLLLIIILLRKL